MVSVHTLGAIEHAFDCQLSKTKVCEIGIGYFSVKHAAWRIKRKELDRNHDNVSELNDISTDKWLCQLCIADVCCLGVEQ